MLATLIIGLREGLEAALIVGIIAAFLRRQQRTDSLRWMWIGVAVAVVICVGVAVGLEALSRDLPQREQEILETVIGAIAVVMVTYMIVWMRKHSRDLKGDLESAATDAMASGSATAFVLMAFLAVLREGLETAVFLVAAFNASNNAVPSAAGAIIGIAIAVILGYAIYRGGVRINLARFFKATGLLLVLVAAGLVMTALHTAHEAGWLDSGQQQVIDLTWLVKPGSVQSSLLTGVLGLQPRPVLIELVGWVVYVVVVGAVVLWPASRAFPRSRAGQATAVLAVLAAVAALVTFVTAPSSPALPPQTIRAPITVAPTTSGILAGRTVSGLADVAVTIDSAGAENATGALRTGELTTELPNLTGGWTTTYRSLNAPTYQQIVTPAVTIGDVIDGAPDRVTLAQVVAANDGRLPVGLDPRKFGDEAPVVYVLSATVTVTVDPEFSRPLGAEVAYAVTATATPAHGPATVLGKVAAATAVAQPSPEQLDALAAASDRKQQHQMRGVTLPSVLAVVAALLALLAAALVLVKGPRQSGPAGTSASADDDHRGVAHAPATTSPNDDVAAVVAPTEERE